MARDELLGLLALREGIAFEVLTDAGVSYESVRREVLGKDGEADASALPTIGIDLDEVRRRVEESFGEGALDRAMRREGTAKAGQPFTPRAKRVLELALTEALALGHNYIGTEHMLLGMLTEGEGLAAIVLGRLAPTMDLRRAVLERLRAAS